MAHFKDWEEEKGKGGRRQSSRLRRATATNANTTATAPIAAPTSKPGTFLVTSTGWTVPRSGWTTREVLAVSAANPALDTDAPIRYVIPWCVTALNWAVKSPPTVVPLAEGRNVAPGRSVDRVTSAPSTFAPLASWTWTVIVVVFPESTSGAARVTLTTSVAKGAGWTVSIADASVPAYWVFVTSAEISSFAAAVTTPAVYIVSDIPVASVVPVGSKNLPCAPYSSTNAPPTGAPRAFRASTCTVVWSPGARVVVGKMLTRADKLPRAGSLRPI